MSNILIFARELVPYCNSVGSSLRAITLARHLTDIGHSVTLLGARGVFVADFGLGELINDLDIVYIDDYLQKFYTTKAAKKSNNKNSASSEVVPVGKYKRKIYKKINADDFILRLIKSFTIPDVTIFFLPKFIFHSLRIIRKKNIDVLIVSSPPHASQILSLLVRLFGRKELEIIVDYRDGWNTFDLFRPKFKFLQGLSKYIEKKVLLACDQFLYQSPRVLSNIADQLSLRGLIESKSTLVRNGYTDIGTLNHDSLQDNQFRLKNENLIRIGYFGGMDFNNGSWRNPAKYLEMFDAASVHIEFTLFGTAIDNSCLPKYSHISIAQKGMVDLHLAKEAMTSFDALFVFHSSDIGSDEVIPGKFYEYIQACRPIIVCGPPLMECGMIVEEYNFGIFIRSDASPENVIKMLADLMDKDKRESYIMSLKAKSHEFSRYYQYNKIKFKR